MKKNPQRLVGMFLAVACLVAPLSASAMSVNEYDSKPAAQRADFLSTTVDKIISDVATVNPALSKAISDYFTIVPPGQPVSLGVTAFEATLTSIENDGKAGKIDLNKAQIEDILTSIIQTNVLPNFTKKNTPTPKPTTNP
jgi:hypothetical protein